MTKADQWKLVHELVARATNQAANICARTGTSGIESNDAWAVLRFLRAAQDITLQWVDDE